MVLLLEEDWGHLRGSKRAMPRKKKGAQLPQAQAQDYVAAVRYAHGRRELFHVLKARDLEDAREMVLCEVGEVRAMVLCLRDSRA